MMAQRAKHFNLFLFITYSGAAAWSGLRQKKLLCFYSSSNDFTLQVTQLPLRLVQRNPMLFPPKIKATIMSWHELMTIREESLKRNSVYARRLKTQLQQQGRNSRCPTPIYLGIFLNYPGFSAKQTPNAHLSTSSVHSFSTKQVQ